jgi:hypothetical protein
MIDEDDDDYGAVGGMRIGRGNRSTRRKPALVPLCPPQIPHDLTWDRTRAAALGASLSNKIKNLQGVYPILKKSLQFVCVNNFLISWSYLFYEKLKYYIKVN